MTVTVLTPTFNRGGGIGKALRVAKKTVLQGF